jgi:hypothetical protein
MHCVEQVSIDVRGTYLKSLQPADQANHVLLRMHPGLSPSLLSAHSNSHVNHAPCPFGMRTRAFTTQAPDQITAMEPVAKRWHFKSDRHRT